MKNKSFLKLYTEYWYIFWFLIYGIFFYIFIKLSNLLNINNAYYQIIFVGVFLGLLSTLINCTIHKKIFRINFNLFIWLLVYILITGFILHLPIFNINLFWQLVVISLLLVIIIKLLKWINYRVLRICVIIITFCIILLVLFVNVPDPIKEKVITNRTTAKLELQDSPISISPIIHLESPECKDFACYNERLTTCKKTTFNFRLNGDVKLRLPFFSANIKREIIGVTNGYCILKVTQESTSLVYPDAFTTCKIPLRDNKYFIYDYETGYFCDNALSNSNTAGRVLDTAIANPKSDCVSLEKYKMSRYTKYALDYYQVIIPDKTIDGYDVSVWNGRDNAIICKKGDNVTDKDYYTCGTLLLSKSHYNEYGDLIYTQSFTVSAIYDRNFNYINTICNNAPAFT